MSEPLQIGRYELVRPIGAGGMGEVFLSREHGPAGLTRWVAVKRVLRHLLSDRQVTELFLREAKIAARLNHPNIVHLIELGEEAGSYFLVMEFVHGRSVRALSEGLPVDCAVSVMSQVLEGLSYAHGLRGLTGEDTAVIHRDVSPDNVLVSFEGVVKVLDFGIAKVNTASALTAHLGVRGKFSYMAPEQFQNQPVSPRTDVYSAGVMLYEILSGRRPFIGDSDAAVMNAVLHSPLLPMKEVAPQVPAGLGEIVERALERSPDRRFESARAMKEALMPFLGDGGAEGARSRLREWMRQHFPDDLYLPSAALEAPERLGKTRPLAVSAGVKSGNVPRRLGVIGALLGLGGVAVVGAWMASPRVGPSVTAQLPPVTPVVQATPVAVIASASVPSKEPATAVLEAPPPAAVPAPLPKARSKPKAVGVSTGILDIQVLPWAEVSIDDRRYGITPMEPVSLPTGQHRVVLRNEELNREKQVTVQVQPGQRIRVRANFYQVEP